MTPLDRAIEAVEVALHSAVAETRVALEECLAALTTQREEERRDRWNGGAKAAHLMSDEDWDDLMLVRAGVRCKGLAVRLPPRIHTGD